MRELPRFRELAVDWRRHLPVVIGSGLAALLGVQAARLAWILLAPVGPVGSPLPVMLPTRTAAAPLASWGDPFHRRDMATNAPSGGITLHGVRIGDGSTMDSAILDAGSGQAPWHAGDAVAAGIVLDTIARDHVWLRVNGARQRIDLPLPRPGATP